jgi:AAA domain
MKNQTPSPTGEHKTRLLSLASDSDKGPTGNHETELLAHMTTTEGMAVVAEEGLGPEVFETPLNRYAFTFALEYWGRYQKAPTREVFVTERPGLKLPEVDPEDDDPKYATGWLVKQLQKRYATNQVQEMVRAAVSTCVADPIGTIKKLAQVVDEANRLVEGDKYTTAYDPLAVAAEVEKLRNRDLAKQLYAAEKNAELVLPPVVSLGALLAKPDTDTAYLIDELAPIGGRVLLSAQFKAGKSTVVGNLVRSLVDGDPFLGRFQVPNPVQRVVLIDNELSEATVQRWLRAQEIKNLDAVADVVTLRGKVNTFNILDDDRTRTRWARRLSDLGADYLILDCLRPCLDALGLSEDKEAGRFLVAYDALLETGTGVRRAAGRRVPDEICSGTRRSGRPR